MLFSDGMELRMRIVLQNSIDSGTMPLFKKFLQFDRGWPRLLADARSPSALPLSNIYPARDRPSRTHHPMLFFYLLVVAYFLLHAKLPDLLASDVGLDIGVDLN